MTVTITREAEGDLERIAGFIALDNPSRAISFVQELVTSCHALSAYPLRYPAVEGFEGRLRRFPWRGYSIYYQVSDDGAVAIVHILNDALEHNPVLRD